MTAVSDASPIIALVRISKLNLLKELFGEIFVSQEVYFELVGLKDKAGAKKIEKAKWIKPIKVKDKKQINKLQKFDISRADASSIALTIELKAVLAVDDLKMRKVARNKNVIIVGTIAVILKAHQKGLIKSPIKILDKLIKTGFRISEKLYKKIQIRS